MSEIYAGCPKLEQANIENKYPKSQKSTGPYSSEIR